jgi:exonuclease III
MTFNVNNDNERTDDLLAWIRRENPDIILLQEFPRGSRQASRRCAVTGPMDGA